MKVPIALISALLAIAQPAFATPGFCDMYEVEPFRPTNIRPRITKAKPDSNTRYFQAADKLWHCNAVTRKAGTYKRKSQRNISS